MNLIKVKGGFVTGLLLGIGFGFGVPMGNLLFMIAGALL